VGGETAREFALGHEIWRNRVDGASPGRIVDGGEDQPDDIVAMDPGRPLPAVADPRP